MANRLPIGYTVRIARITKVGRTYIDCEFYDRFGENPVRCPIPFPYAGRGSGIFAGIEKDTLVLLAAAEYEKWYVVGIIPDVNFYNDVEGRSDINFNETDYPSIEQGEIILKGGEGQVVELLNDGSLVLDAGIGSEIADVELSKISEGLFFRVNNFYQFTEAGRIVEGIIRRDLNHEELPGETQTSDFLASSSYDYLLSNIGRSPQDETHYQTTTLGKSVVRNPALVERKELIYEYADSFGVKTLNEEIGAMNFNPPINPNYSSSRQQRRTDTLNLQRTNYNHLIEKTQGTLVDIYGNVLDLNRNIIQIPDTKTIDTATEVPSGLAKIYKYQRRSIKYHLEINSRKPEDLLDSTSIKADNNEKARSKWSVDVDGEGLTKINIPASSETGNIPILGRYINSQDPHDPINGAFKDPQRRDIWLSQFGAKKVENKQELKEYAGQLIEDTTYTPTTIKSKNKRDGDKTDIHGQEDYPVTCGTAYHDLFNIANSIFTNGKLKSPDLSNNFVPPLSKSINNTIYDVEDADHKPNAGGRSINANLDGSMELSIGADTIDRKSLVLDMAGGLISHVGRDKNGRSVIQQMDGDVIIQVGGKGISNDTRFQEKSDTEERPGRVEVHLLRPGGTSQKLVIDENGLSLIVNGNIVMASTGDFTISAGGRTLINGELINKYGSYDPNTRAVIASEALDRRKGRGK